MSSIKTLSNFKSLDLNVRDATDIEGIGQLALSFQYRYNIRTMPIEFRTWDYHNVQIDVKNIDRLYYTRTEKVHDGLF